MTEIIANKIAELEGLCQIKTIQQLQEMINYISKDIKNNTKE